MNKDEQKVTDILLEDISKAKEPKDKFAAIERYDLFMRAVRARAEAEGIFSNIRVNSKVI